MDEKKLEQVLEKTVNLRKEEGLGWRKIHERLKENIDSYDYGSHASLYKKAKPVIDGEKTAGEMASKKRGGKEKKSQGEKQEESDKIPDKDNLEVGGREEERKENGDLVKYVVIVVWIIALILVYFGFLK